MGFNLATAAPVKSGFDLSTAAPDVPAPKAEQEAPGWFMPGSKSEAAVRGFSQGATLGFGDELQALVRKAANWDTPVAQLRDEQRAANDAAAKANPGIYMASEVAGSLPSYAGSTSVLKGAGAIQGGKAGQSAVTLAKTLGPKYVAPMTAAKGGALIGGVQGLGKGEGDIVDQGLSTASGAGLGALAAGTTSLGAKAATNALNAVKGGFGDKASDTTLGAAAGFIGAKMSGNSGLEGAIAGGIAGKAGVLRTGGKLLQAGAKAVNPTAGLVVNRAAPSAAAITNALVSLSGSQSRAIKAEGDAEIQAAVDRGQPKYAATFTALQNPVYRTATTKAEDSDEETNLLNEED
jgi:hypothetical protein